MILEDFKATKEGKTLRIKYFQGDIIISGIESDAEAHKYLMEQVVKVDNLKRNILKQADKFINE